MYFLCRSTAPVVPPRRKVIAMAEVDNRTDWKLAILGFAVIILVLGVAVYLVTVVYAKFFKPAPTVVAVSAYFLDDDGKPVFDPEAPTYPKSHIKVQGAVSQGDKAVSGGIVRVTIAKSSGLFRQSINVPLKDGHFETEDPAFRSVHPGDPVTITADVSAPGLMETATIQLNSQSPINRLPILIGSSSAALALIVVFFYAFTGRKTALKNRTAIIFSYVVIGLFLALSIVGPVLMLQYFPDTAGNMIGAPAGLVKTHTKTLPKCETQWALNIGGNSFVSPQQVCNPDVEADTAVAATNQVPTQKTPEPSVTSPTVPTGSVSPAKSAQSAEGNSVPAAPDAAKPPKEKANAQLPRLLKYPSTAEIPNVEVQGGLVIPLYVIVLSVIGGAINMTRKVPVYQNQGESEESDFTFGRPVSKLGSQVMKIYAKLESKAEDIAHPAAPPTAPEPAEEAKPELPLEDKAADIEARLQELIAVQIARNGETDLAVAEIRKLVAEMQGLYDSKRPNEPLLKFNSFEDWVASHARLAALLRGSWRVELLNQYMYLISAPFLAIVTYYILDILEITKQGIVVVLSFSVGLISEKIVSWILGIATGYLTDPKKA